jgi:hypothetical protein
MAGRRAGGDHEFSERIVHHASTSVTATPATPRGARPTPQAHATAKAASGSVTPMDDAVDREVTSFQMVDVDCYAGSRGEETPRRFSLKERQIEIVDVVDRWLTPDHRYFQVQDAQGDRYVLRHEDVGDRWELTSVRRGPNDELGADVDP